MMTRQAYHPLTRRLARIRTERFAETAPSTADGIAMYTGAGSVVQDTAYGHDVSGNVTDTWERAPGCGTGPGKTDALDRRFVYDGLYRLVTATGREASLPTAKQPWETAVPRGTLLPDPADTRVYVREYRYTKASAVSRMSHRAIGETGHDFTRTFDVPLATSGPNAGLPLDRLSRIAVGSSTPTASPDYVYDGLGQLVREGSARHTAWSASGKPRSFRVQVERADGTASPPSVYARYLYDGQGNRIRKVTRQQDGGGLSETELGGVRTEHERDADGTVTRTESTTALPEGFEIRHGTPASGDHRPAVRQQLADRNGSGVATLGGDAIGTAHSLISREEYFPYGETALGGATRASARFDGKRRDAESGYYDYGLRTYAAWTCRFISVDPLVGEYPELSAYGYAAGRPVTMTDALGAYPDTPAGTDSANQRANPVTDSPTGNDDRVGLYVIHVHAGEVFDVRFYKHSETLYAVAEYPLLNQGEPPSQRPDWSGYYGNDHDGVSHRDPYVELGDPPSEYRLLDPDSMQDYNLLRDAVVASPTFETAAYQAEVASPSAWHGRGAGSLFTSGSVDRSYSAMVPYAEVLLTVGGGIAAIGKYGLRGAFGLRQRGRNAAGLRGSPPVSLGDLQKEFASIRSAEASPHRNPFIARVRDPSELVALFERWTKGGEIMPASPPFTRMSRLGDGTIVRMRPDSRGVPYSVEFRVPKTSTTRSHNLKVHPSSR